MSVPLVISNSTDLLRIMPCDVICVKADGNYSTLVSADGDELLLSFQLGQVEQMIAEQLGDESQAFVRIGRGAIINRNYIFQINIPRQQLWLRSAMGKRTAVEASKESLKQLKMLVEEESKARRQQ